MLLLKDIIHVIIEILSMLYFSIFLIIISSIQPILCILYYWDYCSYFVYKKHFWTHSIYILLVFLVFTIDRHINNFDSSSWWDFVKSFHCANLQQKVINIPFIVFHLSFTLLKFLLIFIQTVLLVSKSDGQPCLPYYWW